MTDIPIKIQFVKTLSNLKPSRMIVVKADGDSDFKLYVTDKQGVPFPIKDLSGSGSTVTIQNTDGNLDITGTTNVTINISTSLLNIINSALQSGSNISELVNDSGYITISDIPTNLSDFTNDVGYITTYTETDPIFSASEASLLVPGDKANLDNQSGINTGDETTLSIQTKRPLKTINGENLEGVGNIEVTSEDVFQYFKGDLYMCQVTTSSSLNNIGYGVNPTLVGTGTFLLANLSADYVTSPWNTWNSRRQTSATTPGSIASARWAFKIVSVGLGFYASSKVNITMTPNGRFFLGFTDQITDIGNVDPSTLTNIVGFGIDSLDTNLKIINNDSTGTASKTDLGTDFIINNTDDNTYLIEMWNNQNSSICNFRVKNLITNTISPKIEINTNLPGVTDGLAFHLWANNGTDSSAIVLYFSNHTLKRES